MSGAVPLPAAHLRAVWVVQGTPHRPHCCVRFCELALRAPGVVEGGASRGGVVCRCVECPRSGARPPWLSGHRAGCRGPPPTCCGRGCGGVGAQHCPFGCLYALRGAACRGECGWPSPGGWLSIVARGIWCQTRSLSWQLTRSCSPCVSGTGGMQAPQRALLKAGVARCGGGGRAAPGGAPCAVVRGV